MNVYLSGWFLGLSLAGMGLAAWLCHVGFRRLAVRYGAEDLTTPPGVLRILFPTLLALWAYLIGAMATSLAWRIWPDLSSLPASLTAPLGILGLAVAVYFLLRGY